MPPCDDHYQSVPNTTTKCQKKRDRGDRTDVHFFSEDRLFVHAFHDRPGEPSVAAPPTYKSARGASPAVEDLPGDGLRRAERRCARPPPSPSTFSPLLGGDPQRPCSVHAPPPRAPPLALPRPLDTYPIHAHARPVPAGLRGDRDGPRRRRLVAAPPLRGICCRARRAEAPPGSSVAKTAAVGGLLGAQAAFPGGRAAEWWSGDACSRRPVAVHA